MSELKVFSIHISQGFNISTKGISSERWDVLSEMVLNNEISIAELSEIIDIDIESKCSIHYEAIVDDLTHLYPKDNSF